MLRKWPSSPRRPTLTTIKTMKIMQMMLSLRRIRLRKSYHPSQRSSRRNQWLASRETSVMLKYQLKLHQLAEMPPVNPAKSRSKPRIPVLLKSPRTEVKRPMTKLSSKRKKLKRSKSPRLLLKMLSRESQVESVRRLIRFHLTRNQSLFIKFLWLKRWIVPRINLRAPFNLILSLVRKR